MDLEAARWRKSSYSGSESECVEVAYIPGTCMSPEPTWRKSTYSESTTECVEVAYTPGIVAIRDTKNRTAGTLTIPEPTWHDLTSHFRRAAHPIMSTPTSNPEASS